jgi:glycosyltransferase involved in cell wall biosynthesis
MSERVSAQAYQASVDPSQEDKLSVASPTESLAPGSRLLAVLPLTSPLNQDSGGKLRQWNLLLAMREIGDLDVVLLREPSVDAARELSRAIAGKVFRFDVSRRPWSRTEYVRWLIASRLPLEVSRYSLAEVRSAFRDTARRHYDGVILISPLSHVALSHVVAAPSITDLDNLMDLRMSRTYLQRPARRRVAQVHRHVNIARWRRLQARVVRENAATLVASWDERARLASNSVHVVANGYDAPRMPRGSLEVRRPPNILYQGTMTYLPNREAATRLVEEILPRIQDRCPDCRCTIAGEVDDAAREHWQQHPHVRVTGYVPDINAVLATADVVAVPLMIAGGTRLKILEAFAHRIPVVASTIGAEGLNVRPGRELLIEDSVVGFADAVVRLLQDRPLREQLTDSAFEHLQQGFAWSDIRASLSQLLMRTFSLKVQNA